VLSVELERSESLQPESYDVTDIHWYCVKTQYGRLDIELRAAHNGYYGGWLEHGPEEIFSKATIPWRQIEE
jgi:hypothetical protein